MKFLIILILSLAINISFAADIEINNSKVKLVPPVSTTTALFLKIKNNSNKNYKLVKVSSDLSDQIELHEMKMDNNKMEMRAVSSIEIAAKSETELKYGGLHVMIFNLKKPIKTDGKYNFTLEFDNKSKFQTTAAVEIPN